MKNAKPMKNLKKIRKEKGFTQQELAMRCRIRWEALSTYERGVRRPGYDVMKNLAFVLGCSVDDLLSEK